MREIAINGWAVVGAAAANMAAGMLWYSPALFLKRWMELAGVSESQMKQGMGKAIAADAAGSVVTAFVLVHAVRYAGAETAGQGAFVGFWNWLGFYAMPNLASVFYEKRPWTHYWINNGFRFVTIIGMAVVLAVWK